MCGHFKQLASEILLSIENVNFVLHDIAEWQCCASLADVTCQLIEQLYRSAWPVNARCWLVTVDC
jgi:hypothetical protein